MSSKLSIVEKSARMKTLQADDMFQLALKELTEQQIAVFVNADSTTDERIATLVENASGFVYYVSVRGITGTSSAAAGDIESNVARIRKQTDLPIAVGFGIRTPTQAADVAGVADAAVVGTAIVEKVAGALNEQNVPAGDVVGDTLGYVSQLAEAVRSARNGNAS